MRAIAAFFFSNTHSRQILAKNTVWLTAGEVAGRAIKFLFFIYVARVFGLTDFGIFSFALAFVGLFIVFADCGISITATRRLSLHAEAIKDFRSMLGLKFALLAVVFFTLLLATLLVSDEEIVRVSILLVGLYTFSASFIDTLSAYYRSAERMEYEALFQLLHVILASGIAATLVFLAPRIVNVSLGYAIGGMIAVAAASLFFAAQVKLEGPRIDFAYWRQLLAEAWPLGLVAVAAVIYNQIDQVMLGLMRNQTEVGLYSAAFRIAVLMMLPGAMVVRSIFPRLVRSFRDDAAMLRVWRRLIAILTCLSLSLLGVGLLLAEQILISAYGYGFTEATHIFKVLVLASAVNMFCLAFHFLYVSSGRQRTVLVVAAVTALSNIVLNYLLIPTHGMVGAAYTTLFSMVEMVVLYAVIFMWHGGLQGLSRGVTQEKV